LAIPATACSLFCDAAAALRLVASIACSQSNGSFIFLFLFQLVDLTDYGVRLCPTVALVNALPFLVACRSRLRRGPSTCSFVNCGNPVDAPVHERKVGDLGGRSEAPGAHHLIVQAGPHLCGVLNGVLPGETQSAFWPAAPAGLLLDIEKDEVCVRVVDVVSSLVMDCGNISSDAIAQTFCKSARQGLSLLWGGFRRQGNDKPLTDAPFAPLGLFFGQRGCRREGAS
jgi:hypothetical protein